MRIRRILYTSHFRRSLRKYVGKNQRRAVDKKVAIFQQNCFDPRLKNHKLKGTLRNYWAFSVTHSLRIFFEFLEDEAVLFLDIGSHSIYR